MVANSNYEALVENIMKPWPKVGPLLNRFDSSNLKKLCMGSLKQNVWLKLENNFNKKGEDVW